MNVIQTIKDDGGINETIKCECFGLNDFEGEKCETKSTKRRVIETTIKTSTWISVLIIISSYLFIFSMDIHKIMLKLAVYTSTLGEGIRCWLLHRVGLQQRGPGRVHGSRQCQG